MKKTFTFLTAIIVSVTTYAYPDYSTISISSYTGAAMRVMVDGERYRATNNEVTVSGINHGYHTVKIYVLQRGQRGGRGWTSNNDNFKLVYSGSIYVKPQYFVDITINRFGKAFIDEQALNNSDYNDWDNNWDNSNGNYQFGETDRTMSPESFEKFKQSLRNEPFDNTRMEIAKEVISTGYFTTAQIKEILPFFRFESNKLDIAKAAYRNVMDKQDYFTVADSFVFSTNKQELIRFMKESR